MGKDIIADIVEVLCIALVGMILIKFGYYPVSNIPNKFSIWKKCLRFYVMEPFSYADYSADFLHLGILAFVKDLWKK